MLFLKGKKRPQRSKMAVQTCVFCMRVCRVQSRDTDHGTQPKLKQNETYTQSSATPRPTFSVKQLTKPDGTWGKTITEVFTSFLFHPTFWEGAKSSLEDEAPPRCCKPELLRRVVKRRRKHPPMRFWKFAFELVCLCYICFHKVINKKESTLTWTEKADTGRVFFISRVYVTKQKCQAGRN